MESAAIEKFQNAADIRREVESGSSATLYDGDIFQSISISTNSRVNFKPVYQTIHQDDLTKEQKCHQAFKTTSYERQKDRNPLRADGTCRWVLEHPQFVSWRQSQQDALLWISADPGCGKSVLSRSLVDQDLNGEESICYFFFKDNEEQDNLATALCALLHQLFDQQPDLIRHALPAWQKNGDKVCKEISELWRILQRSVSDKAAKPVICILDALDECKDDDCRDLIAKLCSVQRRDKAQPRSPWKILTTSRAYDDVRQHFTQTIKEWPQIHLQGEEMNDQVHQEINLVISRRVDELAEEFALPDFRQKYLLDQLLGMQHRTYLWLHLAIAEIRQCFESSLYPDEVEIPSLPSSVEEAYERILQKIKPKQKANAKRVLCIVVGARRPLTIEEMASALGAAWSYEHDTSSIRPLNQHHLEQQLRQWCGLFIFIQNSKLFLVHQTAKEFLLSASPKALPLGGRWQSCFGLTDLEREMTRLCVTYLSKAQSQSNHDSFHSYCADYWVSHAQDDEIWTEQKLVDRALALYDVGTALFLSWFPSMKMIRIDDEGWERRKAVEHWGSHHAMAATGNLTALTYLYGRSKFDLDAEDLNKYTPLMWAVQKGHGRVTKWLLERGVDVNHQPLERFPALHLGIRFYHEDIVQILLKNGANAISQRGYHGNTLQIAAMHSSPEIVQVLITKGADINVQGGRYGTALQAASSVGAIEVVRVLLENRADVNAKGGLHGNALQAAAAHDNLKVVQMLLENSANVNAQGGLFGNALQAASSTGKTEVVQILVENGADIQAQGAHHDTALQVAASKGRTDVVQILLKNGADVNAQGGLFDNALQAAALGGHSEVVQLLLRNGANIQAQGLYGTAEEAASYMQETETVYLLRLWRLDEAIRSSILRRTSGNMERAYSVAVDIFGGRICESDACHPNPSAERRFSSSSILYEMSTLSILGSEELIESSEGDSYMWSQDDWFCEDLYC